MKEEHKFSTNVEKDDKKYLNLEEKDNLNDMINYVASQTESYPIESLYSNVKKTNYNYLLNEEIDENMSKLLVSEDTEKNKRILELYAQLLNSEKNVLNDRTYLSLVEFFIKYSIIIIKKRPTQLRFIFPLSIGQIKNQYP